MQRKRRKSEDIGDKRVCVSPSPVLNTPVLGQKEQQPTPFEQWGVSEVTSFISSHGFDKYALIFQSNLNVE